jgi:hypothetical protein
MKRILNTIIALAIIVGSASAQTISVQDIEVQAGGQAELVVSYTGEIAMTALQFNMKLPEGISCSQSSYNYGATLGEAAAGHILSVQRLPESGDLLFILYHIGLNNFKEGELLRIPVTVSNNAKSNTGKIYTVRTANIINDESASFTRDDAQFNIVVENPASGLVGDANGNGVVEIGDVTSVLTLMATPEATGYNNKAADANGNGEIEIGDVTTILTIMANGE